MPKRLAILRHAKSDWGDPGLADFDRPLNARGRAAAESIGRALEQRDIVFDAILSSPARRTRETLELIGLASATTWLEPLYHASPERLLDAVRRLPDDAASALIVGHNPGLQQLVLALSAPDANGFRAAVETKFPTAALALLDLAIDDWAAATPGCGRIAELLLPRALD